jgi:hypothetical protein
VDVAEPGLGCGMEPLTLTTGRTMNPIGPSGEDGDDTPLSGWTGDGRGPAVWEGRPEGVGFCDGLPVGEGLPVGDELPVGEGLSEGEGLGLGDGEGVGDGLGLGEGEGHGLLGWPQGFVLTADTARLAGMNTQMPTIKIPTARTFLIIDSRLLDSRSSTR